MVCKVILLMQTFMYPKQNGTMFCCEEQPRKA